MTEIFHSIFRSLIRTLSFPGQEITEILRQPRLVATLVLGPFLILLLVGLGYRGQQPPMRTLAVISDNNPLKPTVEQWLKRNSPYFNFLGTVTDQASALDRLRNDQADLVIIAPENAEAAIRGNQQATFTIYHRQIDPTQIRYISYIGQLSIDEINRQLMQSLTAQGQSNTGEIQNALAAVRTSAGALRDDLQRGDQTAARQHQAELNRNVTNLESVVSASTLLIASAVGANGSNSDLDAVNASLKDIRQNTDAVNTANLTANDANKISSIEDKLAVLEQKLNEFRSLDPHVLASPFRSETKSVAALEPHISDFFAPSVIVLLLQHLAVTFGALSLVRDRRLGLMELYRVSPVSALEILIGKYISYLLFGSLLAALLTLVTSLVLRVPMIGSWGAYALTLFVLLFTSLGLGFTISLISPTDSQAVQFSMIVLLASVFLSGFMLNLLLLKEVVQVVSWMLPATYGISQLQNVALRGEALTLPYIGGLIALGIIFFTITYILLRRHMATR